MNAMPMGDDSADELVPTIAGHDIIRQIGEGGYGKVWLARNKVTGAFRAAKVISRKYLPDERSFKREFDGICNFDPISGSHQALVRILHVDEDTEARYYYYVMELADDVHTGQTITPDTYRPLTLKEEMANHPHLAISTKFQIALSLTSALGFIHEKGLIHRDIKPSNIIFVNGVPKIADIGLITRAGEVSERGTLYYMPGEGPGNPTADIFSLGKVFYELFMGMHPKHFPELPHAAEEFTSVPELLGINNLILKACHLDPRRRFQTAKELHNALQVIAGNVQGGRASTETTAPAALQSTSSVPETTSKAAIIKLRKKTDAPQGQLDARNAPQKVRFSRRAALLVSVPAAVGGAFLLGQSATPKDATKEERFGRWQALYDLLDDKLACFIGYVGTVSPNTKFLIYSRGTDRNWVTPGFQKQWREDIELRFPELKGRVSTTTIPKARATFKNSETAKEMKTNVMSILGLNEGDPMPSNPPVIVLMDTPAKRGVYDGVNQGTGRTNAEELRNELLTLPLGQIHTVAISDQSSKRNWSGERLVKDYKPSLVIIHRSAFFHPVNAKVGLGYPVYDQQDRLIDWEP